MKKYFLSLSIIFFAGSLLAQETQPNTGAAPVSTSTATQELGATPIPTHQEAKAKTMAIMGAKGKVRKPNKNSKKKKTSMLEEVENTPQKTAQHELQVLEKERSNTVLPTPATVRASIEPVTEPMTYTSPQVGLSVQQFNPKGSGDVLGQDSYDLKGLGQKPMITFETRWLPWELRAYHGFYFGGFFNVGYSQHPFNLRSDSGRDYGQTRIDTIKAGAGLASEYHFARYPSWAIDSLIGVGYLESVQSGENPIVNSSAQLPYGSAAIGLQKTFLERWTIFANYEYRASLRPENNQLGIQANNYILGVLGNLR